MPHSKLDTTSSMQQSFPNCQNHDNANLGSLFVISAASGTGKTSLVKALLERTDKLCVSVSHTTRAPRNGEIDGVHYHFVNEDEFLRMQQNGDFLEYACVFGNWYGTKNTSISQKLAEGFDVILEIDVQGAAQIVKNFGATGIFILPPDKSALKMRLKTRAKDDDNVINARLLGAKNEMKCCTGFDYIIINDDFDTALLQLQTIIHACRLQTSKQLLRHKQAIDLLIGDD